MAEGEPSDVTRANEPVVADDLIYAQMKSPNAQPISLNISEEVSPYNYIVQCIQCDLEVSS